MGVLEGDVQVGQDLGIAGHHLDQPVADVAGVGVQDADPVDLWGREDQLLEQAGQPVFQAQVVPVIGRVLGDQNELAHAAVLEEARFGEDRLLRAAEERSL